MASTLTAATATFTVTGTITVSGKTFSISNSWTVASQKDPIHMIMGIPTSVTTVLNFSATPGPAVMPNVNTIIIVNKDDTNFLTVGIKKTGAETAYFKIDAGKPFIISNTKLDIDAGGGAFGAFVDWDAITLMADTAAIDTEIFGL